MRGRSTAPVGRCAPRRPLRRHVVGTLGTLATAVCIAALGPRTAAVPATTLAVGERAAAARTVTDGSARFEVLTPTLIRMEYADDRRFEDRTTFNVVTRDFPVPAFRTTVEEGWLVIRTASLTLRYRRASGSFAPQNTSITLDVGGRSVVAHPWQAGGAPAADPHNLGGWYRAFDILTYPDHPRCRRGESAALCTATLPPLHEGLLSTDGWHLLDDTSTALWRPGSWPRPRPQHAGAYQDGYFFGYGHHYRRALRELAHLTGPAPLLPRWMLGTLYGGCCSDGQYDYETRIVPGFRAEGVPLQALVVDTQWKTSTPASPPVLPDDDGWNWSSVFFPRPRAFLDWAHAEGLHVALNIHPTIEDVDPKFPLADRIAHGLLAGPEGEHGWNWADRRHARSYASLHEPLLRQGVDFWWLDWCCDKISTVAIPGLTPDTWVNRLTADDLTRRGDRGFVLGRIGASTQRWSTTYPSGPWAEHRYTVHFTGDTWSTWNTLAFESRMTIAEGNIGLPYVSHDIGGYLGPPPLGDPDTDDLYARWVQFGAFQPVLRLHGISPRLPWGFGTTARASADRFLRLREALTPYLYTTAREAYDSGLPMVRGLYLDHPDAPEAYRFDGEYMLGDELLVAPVTSPGAVASTRVWFPPGGWVDLFTGDRYQGPGVTTVTSSLDRMPVFVRAGSVLPMLQDVGGADPASASTTMLLRVFAGADGAYRVYDDAGRGPGYANGQYAWTQVRHAEDRGSTEVVVGGSEGSFPVQPAQRRLAIEVVGVGEPTAVRVGGTLLARISAAVPGPGWWYDAAARTLHVELGPVPIHRTVHVDVLDAPDLR